MMDPARLALGKRRVSPKHEKRKLPHHKTGQRFLRGPIPWSWLRKAATASGHGSGFKVAVALWFLAGIHKQTATVKLSGKVLYELGVERHAGYRGLAALEEAGLVTVERYPGRNAVVTILDGSDPHAP
jgi:hypothetical protein